jgi:hypothetical protein
MATVYPQQLADQVTPEQFLAFAVPLERRRIQEANGVIKPFPPLPLCPVCLQPVSAVAERNVRHAHYSIGLGCHRLVTVASSEHFDPDESLLAQARRIAWSLEAA